MKLINNFDNFPPVKISSLVIFGNDGNFDGKAKRSGGDGPDRRDISPTILRSKLDATFINASEYFHVEPGTGSLRTKKMLNHEKARIHRLIVMATDQGKPSLSSSALVSYENPFINY